MTDPTRLLDDLATDSVARSALRAGRADRGPAHRREQLWAALAPQLPLDPSSPGPTAAPPPDPSAGSIGQAAAPSSSLATPGTTAGAATTGATTSTLSAAGGIGALLKAAAAGAGAMGALLGVHTILSPAAPPAALPPAAVSAVAPLRPETPYIAPGPLVNAPSVAATASADPAPPARVESVRPLAPLPPAQARAAADVPADVPADEPPAAPASAPAASTAPGPGEVADRVLQEAALVRRADQALRSGDSAGATRLLDEASQRFPGGVLGQEREVLSIEALARSGQTAAATERARSFLRAHPASPFASRLQSLTR